MLKDKTSEIDDIFDKWGSNYLSEKGWVDFIDKASFYTIYNEMGQKNLSKLETFINQEIATTRERNPIRKNSYNSAWVEGYIFGLNKILTKLKE